MSIAVYQINNNIISQNINSLLTNNKYKTLVEIKQKLNLD